MKCSDEISIGEYVRDIFGRIGQIYQYDHGTYRTKKFGASSGEIVKHSFDIIDLIEVNDYVNGNKVIDIAQAPVKAVYTEDREQRLALIPIVNEQIEIVVTKEQIKQIEFRIGD